MAHLHYNNQVTAYPMRDSLVTNNKKRMSVNESGPFHFKQPFVAGGIPSLQKMGNTFENTTNKHIDVKSKRMLIRNLKSAKASRSSSIGIHGNMVNYS
jgi:hypothetical protein